MEAYLKPNILKEKSYAFALRIVKLFQFLSADKKEYVLSKQVLRSGTSIGANIEEAYQGESNPISFTSFPSPTRKLSRLTIGFDYFVTATS